MEPAGMTRYIVIGVALLAGSTWGVARAETPPTISGSATATAVAQRGPVQRITPVQGPPDIP